MAVECATRATTTVTAEALDAALSTLLHMKGQSAAPAPPSRLRAASPSPFQVADPAWQAPPAFDLQKAIREAKMDGEPDDDEDGDDEVHSRSPLIAIGCH